MDMTIIEQAKGLADKVLAQPATEHDIAVVERQLGRYPRGMVAVGARCVCGRPLAVVTRPLLPQRFSYIIRLYKILHAE